MHKNKFFEARNELSKGYRMLDEKQAYETHFVLRHVLTGLEELPLPDLESR